MRKKCEFASMNEKLFMKLENFSLRAFGFAQITKGFQKYKK